MPTQQSSSTSRELHLKCIAKFPRMRALFWDGDVLYASRGYELLQANIGSGTIAWKTVAHYQPEVWRKITSASKFTYRLFRDGFHALTILPTGHMVAAAPKAIVRLAPGES